MTQRKGIVAAFVILSLCILGVAAGLIAFEIKTRYELSVSARNTMTPMLIMNGTLPPSAPDEVFNRPYEVTPLGPFRINGTKSTAYVTKTGVAFQTVARTNNLGWLSDRPYAVDRPADTREFRIVVMGDSMTGTTTMDFQWVDLLGELLNRRALLEHLNVDAIKTYNCGVPGAGFSHFWDFYKAYCRNFDPDLVIVNYIESDFPRLGDQGHDKHTDDEALMVENATYYMRNFVEEGIPVFATIMPLYQDLFPKRADYHLSRQLIAQVPEMDFYFMRERLNWQSRPEEVYSWYNLPLDGHMSETGGERYAYAMANLIAEWLGLGTEIARRDEQGLEGRRLDAADVESSLIGVDLLEDVPDPASATAIAWSDSAHVTRVGRWDVIADGANGDGVVVFDRVPVSAVAGTEGFTSDWTLRLVERTKPTAGRASISTNILFGWRRIGGNIDIAFRARAVGTETKPVTFMITPSLGDGATTPPTVRKHVPFFLKGEWSDYFFRVNILKWQYAEFGEEGTEHIRISIVSAAEGEDIGFMVTDITARPHVTKWPESDRRFVNVGTRLIPVQAFLTLRDRIEERSVDARTYALTAYAVRRIWGEDVGVNGFPKNKQAIGGFEEVQLPTTPPETVLLNVYCTSEPITIDNPDCYNSFHLYVR